MLKPSCVKILKPDKVRLVSCGKAHTVVVMESGRIFAFGNNAEGQLGVGSRNPEFTHTPVEVQAKVRMLKKIILCIILVLF